MQEKISAQQKMFEEMLRSCNSALAINPSDMELLKMRGILLNQLEKYDAAIKDFNALIKKLPNESTGYYLRSDCFFHVRKYLECKKDYLRALKVQHFASPQIDTIKEKHILAAGAPSEEELNNIKRVLNFEKTKAVLAYFPSGS